MIIVNECRVSNDNTKIYIDVETTLGYKITSAKLWSDTTFKVFAKAKPLNITMYSNREVLTVTAASVGAKKFDGIYFIEFETDAPNAVCSTCPNPVTAVVSNMVSYYKCGMEMILKSSRSGLDIFSNDSGQANNTMTVHLLIDAIGEAIKLNRFVDAINLLANLKKICMSCSECGSEETSGLVDCTDCGSTSIYYN
jgi:hypothetical protein